MIYELALGAKLKRAVDADAWFLVLGRGYASQSPRGVGRGTSVATLVSASRVELSFSVLVVDFEVHSDVL